MNTEFESKDIFKAATLVCQGGRLEGSYLNERRQVVFCLRGEDLDQADLAYRVGAARVNPLQLREVLNWLRDLIFETLRLGSGQSLETRERKESL